MIVHAYHGWAGDAGLWLPLASELGGDAQLFTFDRGYYGNSRVVDASIVPDVLIVHSMGWMFVPEAVLYQAPTVILLNSFSNFMPTCADVARRVRATISMMQANLARNPSGQIAAFCEVAGLPNPSIHDDSIDGKIIQADLERLVTRRLTPESFEPTSSLLFVHASNDSIVHPAATLDTCSAFPQSEHLTLESSQHNLPISHAGMIRNLILGA